MYKYSVVKDAERVDMGVEGASWWSSITAGSILVRSPASHRAPLTDELEGSQ